MLPDNALSTRAMPRPFLGAGALTVTGLTDFEDGGIGIQDPSAGLFYQIWRLRVIGLALVLDAPNWPAYVVHTAEEEVTEVSLTFDQNMRTAIAFVEAGQAKLLWYDTAAQEQVITTLASDVITPRVTLDDKRQSQLGISDIILAYKRGDSLFYRQQRNRFQVEYDPTDPMPEPERTETRAAIAQAGGVIKVGMNRGQRLNFQLEVI